jgi:uncharacterized membrane protein YdjX (TVP38/TMEM64 family)
MTCEGCEQRQAALLEWVQGHGPLLALSAIAIVLVVLTTM